MPALGLENEILHRFEELNWESWWRTVCTLDQDLLQTEPKIGVPSEPWDQRDAIAVATLNLELDWDDQWTLFKMKKWVQHMESQIREIFS